MKMKERHRIFASKEGYDYPVKLETKQVGDRDVTCLTIGEGKTGSAIYANCL